MSDKRSRGRAVLNWRGPLLAGAAFAAVFGLLLLMAHLNQSRTSDEGSGFRQDPYGASLLFDSYERAGYHVNRSQDQKLLPDQDATRTTAFFIGGGFDYEDYKTQDGKMFRGEKFHALLEDFLGRGGRVVLLQHSPGVSVASIPEPSDKANPKPGNKPNSSPIKWQIEKNWGVESVFNEAGKGRPGPGWAEPSSPALPAGSERMYLAADAPWLKTDSEWTPLFVGPVSAVESQSKEKPGVESPAKVYLAMRKVGNGELLVASQESFLLNEAIKTHPNPVLLDFLAGGRPVIWVDETLHGLHQEEGVLWLVQRYRLQGALLLFWASLLALLWSMNGDLVRRPARSRSTEIIRRGEGAGLASQRLLQRSIPKEQVVAECWEQFRRRSPQDAEAISAGPRWGPRLRTALGQGPLAGYKELKHLIAERHASAKGLAHEEQESPDKSVSSPKTAAEEAQIA